MKNIIIIAALMAGAAPVAAMAQDSTDMGNEVQAIYAAQAKDLANESIGETQGAYLGSIGTVDAAKDPWRVVTQEYMLQNTENPNYRPDRFSIAVQVDYDGDGTMDTARMYTNSKQSAVVVKYGATGRNEVVYKQDGQFGEGEQIFAAGNRIALMIPDQGYVLMMRQNDKPVISVAGL